MHKGWSSAPGRTSENKREITGQNLESSAWRSATNWPWLGVTHPILPVGAAKQLAMGNKLVGPHGRHGEPR